MAEQRDQRDAVEVRLTAHDREIAQLNNLVVTGFDKVSRSIGELHDQIGSMGKPDYRVMVAAASFVLAIMVALFSICGFVYVHDRSTIEKELGRLDTTLQREMRQLDTTQTEAIAGLTELSLERHAATRADVDEVKRFITDQVHADLAELRELKSKP